MQSHPTRLTHKITEWVPLHQYYLDQGFQFLKPMNLENQRTTAKAITIEMYNDVNW